MFGQDVASGGMVKDGLLASVALGQPIKFHHTGQDNQQNVGSNWDYSLTTTMIELASIKSMDVAEIPAAINKLFSKQASQSALGSDYRGPDGDGYLDRGFIKLAMGLMFRTLGTGAHSVAYALDDEWIIKMNCSDQMYSASDAGFDWLKSCTQIQTNKFVPQIASLHQEGLMYTAVVERLCENRMYGAPDGGCFLDLAVEHRFDEFEFGQYMTEMVDYPTFLLMGVLGREDLIQLSQVYEETQLLADACDDLLDFNIMLRGGIPVINDPFGDSSSGALAVGKNFSWKMGCEV